MGEYVVHKSLTVALRAATRTSHKALDSQAILVELSRGDIAQERYLIVLKAFERVWRSLEQPAWAALRDRIPTIGPLEDNRSGILAADIRALTGAFPGADPAGASIIWSAKKAAGTVYVLEGARLGGMLIADRLFKAGRPLGAPGYRFFGSAGPDVADRWRRLKAMIDGEAWSDREVAVACEAALATFKAVSDALREEANNAR